MDTNIKKLVNKYGKKALILKYVKKWDQFDIAKKNQAVIMINPKVQNIKEKTAFFGFIDFVDDINLAKQLFERIEKKCKEWNIKHIIGPVNYNIWLGYRWMIEGWDKKKIYSEPENPRYMPEIIKKLGFEIYKTYTSNIVSLTDAKINFLKHKFETIPKDFSIKRYENKKIYSILKVLYKLSSEQFSNNTLYSDISYFLFKKIMINGFKEVNPIVDLVYYNKKPVGFHLMFINPYEKNILVSHSIGVKKEFRKKGIASALLYKSYESAFENNIRNVLHHLIYEKNKKAKNLIGENKIYKKYALFHKQIK